MRTNDKTESFDFACVIDASSNASEDGSAVSRSRSKREVAGNHQSDGNDPALCPVIPPQRGRPADWERPAGRNGVRGWLPNLEIDQGRKRRCLAGINSIEAGPAFQSSLLASTKDYARGAVEYRGAPFMTALTDEVTAADVRNACQNDPRVYRFWVNPYDGGKIITREFVRSYMVHIERAMGCRLAWFGAIHLKPTVAFHEHWHFHVILRGTTLRGEHLRIRRVFMAKRFAAIAEAMLTERLGPMSDQELATMVAVSEANAERNHTLTLLKKSGFKAWERQRFDGVSR